MWTIPVICFFAALALASTIKAGHIAIKSDNDEGIRSQMAYIACNFASIALMFLSIPITQMIS